MRRLAPLVPVLVLAGAAWPSRASAQAGDLDLLLTRAERTDFVETTRYDEVMELSERIAASHAGIHMATLGYTNEGRRLPLLVIGAPDATPAAVRGTGKTRVYLQGNIHGGEVCGKEALLILLRRWASGEYPGWADDLVLLVAPIYNADGNERVDLGNRPRQHGPIGGMGQRPNAQGLDLNRDHTKLDSPEARSLVRFINAYDPHVAVDLHTTNGTRHGYHLTYAPPLHPNTPAAIDDLLRERWLPEVTDRIREKHGWEYFYYGNASDRTGTPGWYTFDHRPRFNNNYVGLRNRVAILSEAYSYATFEDRVRGTLWFVEEILDFAQRNAAHIRRIVEEADRTSVVGTRLALRAGFRESPPTIPVLMGEVDEVRNPYSGDVMLLRRDVREPVPMEDQGTFVPTATGIAPAGYWVLPEAEDVTRRLEAHGLTVTRHAAPRTVSGQRFVIESTESSARAFQGRHERRVEGRWETAELELPAGTAFVSVDQPLGRLAFTLLEPESDDGFVAWAFVDEAIEGGRVPIHRTLEAPRP